VENQRKPHVILSLTVISEEKYFILFPLGRTVANGPGSGAGTPAAGRCQDDPLGKQEEPPSCGVTSPIFSCCFRGTDQQALNSAFKI